MRMQSAPAPPLQKTVTALSPAHQPAQAHSHAEDTATDFSLVSPPPSPPPLPPSALPTPPPAADPTQTKMLEIASARPFEKRAPALALAGRNRSGRAFRVLRARSHTSSARRGAGARGANTVSDRSPSPSCPTPPGLSKIARACAASERYPRLTRLKQRASSPFTSSLATGNVLSARRGSLPNDGRATRLGSNVLKHRRRTLRCARSLVVHSADTAVLFCGCVRR